jgi:hypothetical protein
LHENFTAKSLALFIMGDGYWDKHSKSIKLCTDNFTREQVDILIILLKSKFNLNATRIVRNGKC